MGEEHLQSSVSGVSWQWEGTAAAKVEVTGCSLMWIGQVDVKLVTQW